MSNFLIGLFIGFILCLFVVSLFSANGREDDDETVVRCNECRFCEDMAMSGLWCKHPDNRNPLGCRPEDYCSDGERKGSE